jgi:hypothetical protein
MCLFVTGLLPSTANLAAVRSIVGPEGSAWRPFDEPSIQRQLPGDLQPYVLTGSTCDCDTVLGSTSPTGKSSTRTQ